MASYYEDLLKRIKNVDLKGSTANSYTKTSVINSSAGSGYTALATPDGRVFGTSNYAPSTPAEQAYKSIAAPAASPVSAPAIASSPVAPAATPAPPTGLPGTFGGSGEVGSSSWWTDGRGGNQSVIAPGANIADAQARLARQAEVDRMNQEAERRMSGSRRVGGPATPAAPGYDKKIMGAQASLDKDRAQMDQREGTLAVASANEKQMQAMLQDPVMQAAWTQFLSSYDASKSKKKEKED